VGAPLIHMLGLEADITQEDGQSQIKLPVYLPDASVHMSPSSRSSSPEAHLPTLTVYEPTTPTFYFHRTK
jgi:hypothetical protein